ncbi:MAG: histidine phosphatase family protein [Actinobacteria bacterium]|nr:histidine phosphatase family protein [Actinomycetota bacterium]
MPVLLLRHAVALARDSWSGDDADRPLADRGRRQAEAVVSQLRGMTVRRALSSPTVRCLETLAPLAEQQGLDVEQVDDLAEGNGRLATDLVLSLVDQGDYVVLCTHGDVIGEVLNALEKDGAHLGTDDRCQKGSTWVLDRQAGGRLRGRYLPPPA